MILKLAKPSITSYLHYAHDLSIIETDSRAREYLAVSFLHLITTPDSVRKGIMLDFCNKAEGYPVCPFLSNELLTGDGIALYGDTAVDKVCALIDQGYYVRVNLNEFYIAESASYQIKGQNLKLWPKRMRPIHFNLIHGYDVAQRTFFTHGFDRQMHFTKRQISFEEFEQAYYGDEVGMHRLRLLSRHECEARLYDPGKVAQCLTDFLASQCSYPQLKPVTAWTRLAGAMRPHATILGLQLLGSSFGIAVYDIAARMVERNNGALIDIRPWCVIHDHKRALLRLCDYLARDQGFRISGPLLDEFESIENDFSSLRNYLVESKLNNRKVAATRLKNNLDRLKSAERVAVGELIDTIRGGQP